MKLKLEQQDPGTILTVTESIEPAQVAVIKAGLAKIWQTPRPIAWPPLPLLIDLCELPASSFAPLQPWVDEFRKLRIWALRQDREIFIASSVPELGDTATLATGLELLASAPARTSALASAVAPYLAKLRRQKQALETRVAALEPGASRLRRLRKENSDLRHRVQFAESRLLELKRESAPDFEENAARLRTAEQALTAVLTHQGLWGGGAR